MATQGQYPLNGRIVQPSDIVTGVVSGATADIPISNLLALVTVLAGPTVSRPVAPLIGQMYFDLTLGYPIWCQNNAPVTWVNAVGAPA